jgi:hypothetical protein
MSGQRCRNVAYTKLGRRTYLSAALMRSPLRCQSIRCRGLGSNGTFGDAVSNTDTLVLHSELTNHHKLQESIDMALSTITTTRLRHSVQLSGHRSRKGPDVATGTTSRTTNQHKLQESIDGVSDAFSGLTSCLAVSPITHTSRGIQAPTVSGLSLGGFGQFEYQLGHFLDKFTGTTAEPHSEQTSNHMLQRYRGSTLGPAGYHPTEPTGNAVPTTTARPVLHSVQLDGHKSRQGPDVATGTTSLTSMPAASFTMTTTMGSPMPAVLPHAAQIKHHKPYQRSTSSSNSNSNGNSGSRTSIFGSRCRQAVYAKFGRRSYLFSAALMRSPLTCQSIGCRGLGSNGTFGDAVSNTDMLVPHSELTNYRKLQERIDMASNTITTATFTPQYATQRPQARASSRRGHRYHQPDNKPPQAPKTHRRGLRHHQRPYKLWGCEPHHEHVEGHSGGANSLGPFARWVWAIRVPSRSFPRQGYRHHRRTPQRADQQPYAPSKVQRLHIGAIRVQPPYAIPTLSVWATRISTRSGHRQGYQHHQAGTPQ